MIKPKLIRITTVPISLEKLLEGQLRYMNQFYNVTAVSSEKQRLEKYGENEGVPTFYLPLTRKITPFQDPKAIWNLYKFLKKEKPQIVHTHTPKAGMVGMIAAYLAKVPNRLHTVAGLPLMETVGFKRKILNVVEKLTYKLATNVYPNSKGLQQIIISEKFTKPSKLKIIGNGSSNGIDTDYFSPTCFSEKQLQEKRKELGIPNNDFVFIFVGRLVTDKGINELVEAFHTSDFTLSTSLLLVGPEEKELYPLSDNTRKIISENSKIITTGYQEDVRVYYALSNALVFPSYREGFPNVVMQAGAMGLPSVVTNINGCNEIIENGVNGLIIQPKNTLELQQTMEELISNPSLVKELSASTRAMITKNYKRELIWQELLKEYKTF
ncbi:MAG: glycosyltransferase family 4 protein [Flavobacteriaceae bacterium]